MHEDTVETICSSKPDIFIHDILLNFAAVLALTRTVGNYKLTLKFRAKIKEQFVIHDITEKKKQFLLSWLKQRENSFNYKAG